MNTWREVIAIWTAFRAKAAQFLQEEPTPALEKVREAIKLSFRQWQAIALVAASNGTVSFEEQDAVNAIYVQGVGEDALVKQLLQWAPEMLQLPLLRCLSLHASFMSHDQETVNKNTLR